MIGIFQSKALKKKIFGMEEADKVCFIREGLIEQERLKLNTAQGKRVIPVLLRLQDYLNDIE